ncbi:MAG: RNA-binding cell elongation regulator Jag/EloR [Armatimonadota bacterium]|nr:RNA-binding cell elongation regulator Jag/EloR [Armatimonadota bacterium]MDR7438903.1 RNA-binding cell elongation regulator Jag/EloR [Armatimonadota bacterium]MDR7562443.1 RNA-binding cell elongation regulator Jag/EloR [Armatimonadota bacterium]MDR7567031.1 RNA-binding cell elongation regulator Jag/EloR [Armatimonadota bacterium]MDR7601156.1 RNA-binding cell elongation regulator Jag/EloR [Armatimonadota bacterium]
MREFIGSGRTVEEAIEAALRMSGLSREEAEIEVLDEGSRGFLGLGGREARVRVVPKGTAAPEADQAAEIARTLLRHMGLQGTVRARRVDQRVAVEVEGEDLAALIGRHGRGLQAFEAVLSLLVHRAVGWTVPVEVDAAGYRERRRSSLVAMAQRAAQRAVREGRSIHLPPMDPRERRIVHTALASHPEVTTHSEGEGKDRHVVVEPRKRPRGRRPVRGPRATPHDA